MSTTRCLLVTTVLCLVLSRGAVRADSTVVANDPPQGFTALFNGENLAGWFGMGHVDPRKLAVMSEAELAGMRARSMDDVHAHWSVENGELVNDGHGLYLTTESFFGDIELLVDYKTVAGADSGIYLRATPQVQIWDTTREGGKWGIGADKGSGGLWNNRPGSPGKDPLVHADRPFGEWNHFRILQVGARTTVYLNDKLVVDHAIMDNFQPWGRDKPLARRGPIQLQTHGGEIRWRNIFVRAIAPGEANEILARHGGDGFEPIFNGKDFTGWAWQNGKPVTTYEVADGAIRCKKGHGGTIYYNEELADFMARLEFKLPPGGNNGLAIRYPGSGDTAYRGMCELQVIDNEADAFRDKLNPRQYHGSAYGMAAAYRGYLRRAGEWNFQEVTVRGSKIRVELNGTVILDTDLDKITEYMNGTPHPGKDNESGYFGFAGHGDPVMFRRIRIKRL